MKDREKEEWSKSRAKGARHYILSRSIGLTFMLTLGQTISQFSRSHPFNLSTFVRIVLLAPFFGIVFANLSWDYNEKRYLKKDPRHGAAQVAQTGGHAPDETPAIKRLPKSWRSWQAFGLIVSLILVIAFGILDFEMQMRGGDSTPTAQWVRVIANSVVGFFLMFFAGRYVVLRRKIRKASTLRAQRLVTADGQSPILYLRSFGDDSVAAKVVLSSTEEEELAMIMGELGPFIAIGQPGQEIPELGASRMYVGDSWQKTVTDLMSRARLVVLRIGKTEGLWWEIEKAIQRVKPERLLFLVTKDKSLYEDFRQKAEPLLPCTLPEYKVGIGHLVSVKGFLYFEPDWTPHLVKIPLTLEVSTFRGGWKNSGETQLKLALRPVFEQLGFECKLPPVSIPQVLLAGWLMFVTTTMIHC